MQGDDSCRSSSGCDGERAVYTVSGECLRLGLADEVRYSIMPVLIGEGVSFFDRLGKDVALHLAEVKGYESGMVALRYEVRR